MRRNINQIGIAIVFFCIIMTATANNYSHCFDVLDKYNAGQINHIYQFKVDSVANTFPANKMFECYLKETRRNGVKSDDEKHFDVYRKCIEYKKLNLPRMELSHIDELENMGLPLYLENHVRGRIEQGDANVTDNLRYIQDELSKKIEMSDQYVEYRRLVHAKLTTVAKSGQRSLATSVSVVFAVIIALLIY